jgi:hypothetical protein
VVLALAFRVEGFDGLLDELAAFLQLLTALFPRLRELLLHCLEVIVVNDALLVQCLAERASFSLLLGMGEHLDI